MRFIQHIVTVNIILSYILWDHGNDSPEFGVLPQDHKARMAAMIPPEYSADHNDADAVAQHHSYLRTHSTTSAVDYKYFDVGIGQVING